VSARTPDPDTSITPLGDNFTTENLYQYYPCIPEAKKAHFFVCKLTVFVSKIIDFVKMTLTQVSRQS